MLYTWMENMEQLNLLTLSHDQINVSSYTKLHCITEQLSDQNRGKTGNTCDVLIRFPRFMQLACQLFWFLAIFSYFFIG